MTPLHAVIMVTASFVLITVATAIMIRVNRSERRSIDRRRQEWIAGGRIPEEEPNFYSGSGGGQVGS